MNSQGLVFAVGRKCVEQYKTLGAKAALEAYAHDDLDEDELIAALLLRCRHDLSAIKDALSLLDEYHRRGLIDTSVFLNAKTEVNLLMFRSNAIARSNESNTKGRPTTRSTNSPLDQFSNGLMD
jgi:hypothetical protein